MRLPTILFAAAMCAALATPAFPQLLGETSCGRATNGPVTIRFNPPPIRNWQPITGGPYSAVQSQQSVQTLADGTHLTTRFREEIAAWRDSAGRQRTETRAAQGEKDKPCNSSMLMISDPVAGYVYLLDPADQTAYRLTITAGPPMPAKEISVAQKPASAPADNPPGAPAISTESLGEKTMFGITVTGTLRTLTYPAGSRIGNDRPVTTTEEHWVSPQLGLIVYSHDADPSGRVATFTLRDLSVAEPDPSLFKVPPGYRIIDENDPFTVEIPSHN